jgi:membrane-bound serine protease (ClpP class)
MTPKRHGSRMRWATITFLIGLGLHALADAPKATVASPPPTGKVVEIVVEGEIDLGLAAYLERALESAQPGEGVVVRVNTFGGRIDAAVRIRDAMLRCKGRTLAFVEGRAISAGALITLGADKIYMSGGATIGAATPITLQGGEMKPVEAKVISYFRKEMKATAEAKGRRGDLAEAMVDPAVEIAGLDGKDTTLTLTTPEALRHNLIDGQAATLGEALKAAGWPDKTQRVDENWAEQLARTLSDSRISSLLMTIGMIGILIELWAPGHMLAGLVGAACLLLFFFGHWVVHLAGLGEIILFIGGAAAVVIELVFFPGHGAVAGMGILAILAALVMALIGRGSLPFDIAWAMGAVTRALTMVSGAVLATTATMFFVVRKLPSTRFGKALVLETAIHAHAGTEPDWTGSTGTTTTALRPAGTIDIAGKRVDVVSDGGFIDSGVKVKVLRVEGTRVVVSKINEVG